MLFYSGVQFAFSLQSISGKTAKECATSTFQSWRTGRKETREENPIAALAVLWEAHSDPDWEPKPSRVNGAEGRGD
jgi:hypothetical protein